MWYRFFKIWQQELSHRIRILASRCHLFHHLGLPWRSEYLVSVMASLFLYLGTTSNTNTRYLHQSSHLLHTFMFHTQPLKSHISSIFTTQWRFTQPHCIPMFNMLLLHTKFSYMAIHPRWSRGVHALHSELDYGMSFMGCSPRPLTRKGGLGHKEELPR